MLHSHAQTIEFKQSFITKYLKTVLTLTDRTQYPQQSCIIILSSNMRECAGTTDNNTLESLEMIFYCDVIQSR